MMHAHTIRPVQGAELSLTTWTSLPQEVVFTILSFLDVADLLQCSRVNHELRESVLDPILHQYRKRTATATLRLELTRRKTRAAISPPNALIWLNKTQALSRNISRSLAKIHLGRHLEHRPTVQDLIARGVLPTFICRTSPVLAEKQCQIHRSQLRHKLERKLGRRPSRKSLINLNILPEECTQPAISVGLISARRQVIKESLKDGLRAWVENRGVAAQRQRSAEMEEVEHQTVAAMVRRLTARAMADDLDAKADSISTLR